MRFDIRKIKSRGFTLVELLIVIATLGILAGMAMLAIGRSRDSTEAAAIMANLEAAKGALLTYSMEYRTRNVDPLKGFVGAGGNTINTSLDKYMDSNVKSRSQSAARHFQNLEVTGSPPDSPFRVGFENITVTPGVKSALQKRVDASGGEYTHDSNGTYSIWLLIR